MGDAIRYNNIGTLTSGKAATLRSDAAASIPTTFAYVQQMSGIDLYKRIIQAKGGAVASAGTHVDGCALDLRTRDLSTAVITKVVAALRECGWVAHWRHTGSFANNQHIHASADTGNYSKTYYQVTATKAGYNGLGSGGRGGRDEHKKPSQWRTIQQGIKFAESQLKTQLERLLDSMDKNELKALIKSTVEEVIASQKTQDAVVKAQSAYWWTPLQTTSDNAVVKSSRNNNFIWQTIWLNQIVNDLAALKKSVESNNSK